MYVGREGRDREQRARRTCAQQKRRKCRTDGQEAAARRHRFRCRPTAICLKAADFDGELFGAHILAGKPFIVRGFGNDWRMRRLWRRDSFLEKYGDLVFKTGAIGYASALGKPMPEMTVREYVRYMESTEQEYNNTLYIFQNDIIGRPRHGTMADQGRNGGPYQ